MNAAVECCDIKFTVLTLKGKLLKAGHPPEWPQKCGCHRKWPKIGGRTTNHRRQNRSLWI